MTYDRLLRQVWIRYTIFPSIFQLYCVMFACDRWSIINVTNAYIRFDLVVSLFTTFYEICSHKRTWSFFFQLKYQTVPYGQLVISNLISLFWFDFLLIASNHKTKSLIFVMIVIWWSKSFDYFWWLPVPSCLWSMFLSIQFHLITWDVNLGQCLWSAIGNFISSSSKCVLKHLKLIVTMNT